MLSSVAASDTQAPSTSASASSGSSSSRIPRRLAVSGPYSQGHIISSSFGLRHNGQTITYYPTPIDQTDMNIEPPPYPFNIPATPSARERQLQHSPPAHFYYRQSDSPSSVLSTDSSVRHKSESQHDDIYEEEYASVSRLSDRNSLNSITFCITVSPHRHLCTYFLTMVIEERVPSVLLKQSPCLSQRIKEMTNACFALLPIYSLSRGTQPKTAIMLFRLLTSI